MPTLFTSSAQKTSRDALMAQTAELVGSPEEPNLPQPSDSPKQPEQAELPELSPEVQQTFFAEDVVIQQTARPKMKPSSALNSTPQPKWRTYVPLASVLGGSLILVLGLGIWLRPKNQNQGNIDVIPVTQTENTTELSVLQRELVLLEKDVEAADPLQAKLAFPPVNFSLRLEEATLLQQKDTNRFR